MMKIFLKCLLLFLSVLSVSCQREKPIGYLHIHALTDGFYDIYKLSDTSDFEFVAETRGVFNDKMSLDPGSYLISADCSSQKIIIYPEQTIRLAVNSVDFKPIRTPQPTDRFSIECVRQSSIQMTQVIRNRFNLFMFAGNHALLVNQVTKQILIEDNDQPQRVEILLSALNVERHEVQAHEKSSVYFVSNFDEHIGLTTAQDQGFWQHLLPGKYYIEMNGTRTFSDLQSAQELIIKPAILQFLIPENVDLEKAEAVLRSPLHIDLNDGHFLSYNSPFPILAGKFSFRPSQYMRSRTEEVQAGEIKEISLKSTEVISNCAPWDYSCIGAYDIHLYEEKEIYPLVKTVSGVPIIHLDEPLHFAVQGASRIKVPLTDKPSYNIGRIIIKPMAVAEDSFTSDLIRIESREKDSSAFTNDITFNRENVIVLPEGQYFLANYVTLNRKSGMRRRLPQLIEVSASQDFVYTVPVYLHSDKAKTLHEQIEQNTQPISSRLEKLSAPKIPTL